MARTNVRCTVARTGHAKRREVTGCVTGSSDYIPGLLRSLSYLEAEGTPKHADIVYGLLEARKMLSSSLAGDSRKFKV